MNGAQQLADPAAAAMRRVTDSIDELGLSKHVVELETQGFTTVKGRNRRRPGGRRQAGDSGAGQAAEGARDRRTRRHRRRCRGGDVHPLHALRGRDLRGHPDGAEAARPRHLSARRKLPALQHGLPLPRPWRRPAAAAFGQRQRHSRAVLRHLPGRQRELRAHALQPPGRRIGDGAGQPQAGQTAQAGRNGPRRRRQSRRREHGHRTGRRGGLARQHLARLLRARAPPACA